MNQNEPLNPSVDNANESNHLPVGAVMAERYEIENVLGVGGFSIVYKAYDKKLQTHVAIKELYPPSLVFRNYGENCVTVIGDKKDFDYLLDRFVLEARTMAKYSSDSNIVNIYDCVLENNTAYIIMEYLEGQNLQDYIRNRSQRHQTQKHHPDQRRQSKNHRLRRGAFLCERKRSRQSFHQDLYPGLCAAGTVSAGQEAGRLYRRLRGGRDLLFHADRRCPRDFGRSQALRFTQAALRGRTGHSLSCGQSRVQTSSGKSIMDDIHADDTLELWLPVSESDARQSMQKERVQNAVLDYTTYVEAESGHKIEVHVTFLPESGYPDAISKAYKSGQMPDIYDSSSVTLQDSKLLDCTDLIRNLTQEDYALYDCYQNGQIPKTAFALGFDCYVLYTMGALDQIVRSGKALAYVGKVSESVWIEKSLPGFWLVRPLPGQDSIPILPRTWSVYRHSDNRTAAASVLLFYFAGDGKQDELYLRNRDILPANRKILSEYAKFHKSFSFITDNSRPFAIA